MKVSDYIAYFLHERGVPQIFELVGGMTTHMIDSIHRAGKVRIVSVHHEQAAAFAADATGRLTGIPGVAMATSGPGAINLLTGIGSCYFDSSPAVFITGQVNRHEQKGARPIRQLGFQEADIVRMAAPITKAAHRVDDPFQVPQLLTDSFRLACSGRPGPVLLDIPMDVQRADIPIKTSETTRAVEVAADPALVSQVLLAVRKAHKPLILVGGGIHSASARQLFREFVASVKVPVVSSLMAVDALPFDDPLRVGMIGSYGNRWANTAIARSDLLVVIGSRLDVRQTGSQTEEFKANRVIYHVDCEPGEINNRVTGCHAVVSHIRPFLETAIRLVEPADAPSRDEWLEEIANLRHQWPDTKELSGIEGINPNVLMHAISESSLSAPVYVSDVGQHQMWAAQSLELTANQRWLTSGGMGAMGFGLPAAIGASFAHPGLPIVLIAGDGGFQLNVQELQTVVRNRLPIKMVVLNNGCHGMVRQFQQSYFEERYQSTYWGYSAPDFVQVARAFGISAATVADPLGVRSAIGAMWAEAQTPYLLQVMISTFANAYPKLAFGRPITEMEPFASPVGIEST